MTWELSSSGVYALERSLDLSGWRTIYQNILGIGPVTRSLPIDQATAFFRVVSAAQDTGREATRQWVDDFSWPLAADPTGTEPRDYRQSNRLDAERGSGGGGAGARFLYVTNGWLHLQAAEGAFTFVFNSLQRSVTDPATLDFSAPLPAPIAEAWQMPITGLRVVARGTGTLKLELKDRYNQVLWWQSLAVHEPAAPLAYEVPLTNGTVLAEVKLLNLVGLGPCDLEVDEVALVHSVPAWLYRDPLRYAFVTSYAVLLRGYDAASGRTCDKIHSRRGSFDSLPACGFQALGAAMAADLGVVDTGNACQIVSNSVAALLAVPRHRGLPPHWMAQDQPVNYSTVDAALALISALQAARILEMPDVENRVLDLARGIEWSPLINARDEVSHGYAADGTVLPHVWTPWGGESRLVQWLHLLPDANATLFAMDPEPPVYGGRGFIGELGALFAPQFGVAEQPDRHGVVWRQERLRMLGQNRQYFPAHYPGSVAAGQGWYGLSVVEIIDASGTTAYLEGGLGTATVPARDGGGWLAPHYAAMTASLDRDAATNFVTTLRDLGLLVPLGGLPESVKAGNAGDAPERWHSVQVTLNAFFATAGFYHAIRAQDGGEDVVYAAARTHSQLRDALARLFP